MYSKPTKNETVFSTRLGPDSIKFENNLVDIPQNAELLPIDEIEIEKNCNHQYR